MARILPWETSSTTASRPLESQATPRSNKNKSDSSICSEGRVSVKPVVSSSPARQFGRKRALSPSPSTSPPPGPPPVQFMHDGYDEDDIYIMVEDEFHALAQSFTHHLHHAEYKRLQRKAREAPPRAIPKPKSSMSLETRRKLEAKSLQEKQNGALNTIVSGIDIEESETDEEVPQQANEPWSGTHLAGLMQSSNQKKTALVGLQKIPSSTRAARGFGRGEGGSPQKRKLSMSEVFDARRQKAQSQIPERNSDLDKDRLDKPRAKVYADLRKGETRKDWRSRLQHTETSASGCANETSQIEAELESPAGGGDCLRSTRVKPVRSNFMDDFDEFEKSLTESKAVAKPNASPDPFTERKLAKEEERKKKERRMRASEIPTFLDLT